MPARRSLDRRSGPVPEIRSDGDDVTFLLDVTTADLAGRLALRCDAEGNVWVSIAPQAFDLSWRPPSK